MEKTVSWPYGYKIAYNINFFILVIYIVRNGLEQFAREIPLNIQGDGMIQINIILLICYFIQLKFFIVDHESFSQKNRHRILVSIFIKQVTSRLQEVL